MGVEGGGGGEGGGSGYQGNGYSQYLGGRK